MRRPVKPVDMVNFNPEPGKQIVSTVFRENLKLLKVQDVRVVCKADTKTRLVKPRVNRVVRENSNAQQVKLCVYHVYRVNTTMKLG